MLVNTPVIFLISIELCVVNPYDAVSMMGLTWVRNEKGANVPNVLKNGMANISPYYRGDIVALKRRSRKIDLDRILWSYSILGLEPFYHDEYDSGQMFHMR